MSTINPMAPPPPGMLTPEQEAKIKELQEEIEEMWSDKNKGNYQVDDDAWETMPVFMNEITESDVKKNEQVAALSSLAYDGKTPEEIAKERKEHGNKMIAFATDPAQENKRNFAFSAIRSYTEAIEVKCDNATLNAQLWSNRSMANFLLGNYGHALTDAMTAVKCDAKYAKAYFRAAKAAHNIKKWEIGKSFCKKGIALEGIIDTQKMELQTLLETIVADERKDSDKARADNRKSRVAAVVETNLARKITSTCGIIVSDLFEIPQEQLAQAQIPKPAFDASGHLHIPLLLLYDEFDQSDILQDVDSYECTVADVVHNILPVPWDTRGRYKEVVDVLVAFKIDDGKSMPKYYEACLNETFIEVMKRPEYSMPGLLPTFHIAPRNSDIVLKEWKLQPQKVML